MLSKRKQTQIISLAVRFAAYTEHAKNGDWKRASVWAGMLMETQKQLGVEVVSENILEGHCK